MDADPGHLAPEIGLVGTGQAVWSGGRAGVPTVVRVLSYFADINVNFFIGIIILVTFQGWLYIIKFFTMN